MVYVFKTSVDTPKAIRQLKNQLNKLLKTALWNFDLEDCDKILRIETETNIKEEVVKLLQEKGFICEELPD